MDRTLLQELFLKAVAAAQPALGVKASLPAPPAGRTIVVGAGKASAHMAKAFEEAWSGPLEGLVVTPYRHGVPCQRIEIVEAGHPVPDEAGLLAARRLMARISGLSHDDLVVALISGGGSSLLASPAAGMSFADEQALNRALLTSGAPISVMNRIRIELSAIKGGRLALHAAPARVVTLIVSDIPGDDPTLVGSGPTVPSASSRAEIRRLVTLYNIGLPAAATAVLAGDTNPAPQPGDPRLAQNTHQVIASSALSLAAAASAAAQQRLTAHILSDAIEGEAREVAKVHAALAREIGSRNRPFTKPALLLSGGETSVTLKGTGRGGRNSEFMLAFALAIEGLNGISALAADTDGIDGSGDNAGALADGQSAARMRQAGIDPLGALANNDAYTAFKAIDGLVSTGPTGTNVNDFRAILVR